MIITEKIETSDKILASGGFADVRSGMYMGHLVAVKTLRVAKQDDLTAIRKVNIGDIFSATEARSQQLCSSDFARKSFSGTRYPIRTS